MAISPGNMLARIHSPLPQCKLNFRGAHFDFDNSVEDSPIGGGA
jgi:hypothetical protein